jgi:type I restriction enzyme S subunit
MSEGIPEGWRIASIGDISIKVGSGITPRGGSKVYTSYGVKFIRSQNVRFEGLTVDDIAFIPYEIHESMSSTKLKEGDILLNITGASIGRCTFVPKGFGEGNVNQHVCIIRPTPNTDTKYVSKWLSSDKGQNAIFTYQAGGNREGLNFFQIRSIRLPLPPYLEQQKIAAILTSVDDVIEKTEAQIHKLQDLKKGMMQELLTTGIGHTEFKDSPVGRIPKEWDVVELNHLASIRHGFAFFGEYFSTERTEYTLLTPGNFHRDGHLYFGDNTKYFTGEIPEDFVLNNGDVLVVMTDLTKEMTILGNSVVLNTDRTVLHNQRIGKLQILKQMKSRISSSYLNLILNSFYVKNHVKNTATGTTVRHTSPTKILEPLIPLPPFAEQEDIVRVLESIQNDLVLSEEKKEAVQLLKKALMQDLLTGKVRVNVD